MSNYVIAYSSTSSDGERMVLGSKQTMPCLHKLEFKEPASFTSFLEYKELVNLQVLLCFTRTCTTYITFFDVKFEHSNLQGP